MFSYPYFLVPLSTHNICFGWKKNWCNGLLTLKAPPMICSRRQFQILLLFQKYHTLFFWKLRKMTQILSSAAVVIGALRANCLMFCFQAQPWICIWTESGEPLHLPIFDHLRSSPWEDCSIYINMAWYILISNVSDSILIWNERGMKFPTMWYVRPAKA